MTPPPLTTHSVFSIEIQGHIVRNLLVKQNRTYDKKSKLSRFPNIFVKIPSLSPTNSQKNIYLFVFSKGRITFLLSSLKDFKLTNVHRSTKERFIIYIHSFLLYRVRAQILRIILKLDFKYITKQYVLIYTGWDRKTIVLLQYYINSSSARRCRGILETLGKKFRHIKKWIWIRIQVIYWIFLTKQNFQILSCFFSLIFRLKLD